MKNILTSILSFFALIPTLIFGGGKSNIKPPSVSSIPTLTVVTQVVVPTKVPSTVTISLESVDTNELKVNGQKDYHVVFTFPQGNTNEKIDAAQTVVQFDTAVVKLSESQKIDTTSSHLDRILLVDDPKTANEKGKAVIALGAAAAGEGPTTDKPLVLASLTFIGISSANGSAITFGKTQVVNNASHNVTPDTKTLNLTVLP